MAMASENQKVEVVSCLVLSVCASRLCCVGCARLPVVVSGTSSPYAVWYWLYLF